MPTTTGIATEFIQFTRASNATVTDSDGKVKWAPHNLLLASESFDAAAWGSKAYVTANSAVAPNGTTTADRINNTGAADNVAQTATVSPGVAYTFRFWAKNNGGTTASYRVYDNTNFADIVAVTSYFSLINGSTWTQITVTFTAPAGCTTANCYVTATNGPTNNVFVWGASLYRSDLAMQPNTSAYPMYNPTTPKNLLGYTESLTAGWTGTNGVLQGNGSELVTNGTFNTDTSGWTASASATLSTDTGRLKVDSSGSYAWAYQAFTTVIGKTYSISFDTTNGDATIVSIFVGTDTGLTAANYDSGAKANGSHFAVFTATATTTYFKPLVGGVGKFAFFDNISVQEAAAYEAPNGLQTARAVDATAANGTLLSSLSLLASPYTFSVWLKRKTGSGTVEITVDGTTYVAAAVTGTWTRFSTTLTPTAGTKTPGIRLVTSGDAVYAWGAQLSDSASLDSYSPVYGAAVTSAAYYGPRRDFDGATLACKGLLVEELRTNLLLYSAQFDVSANWAASAGVSISANSTISPDGTLTADTMTSSAGNQITQEVLPIANTIYTNSLYYKKTIGATYQPGQYLYFYGGTSVFYIVRLNTDTGEATPITGGGYTAPVSYSVTSVGNYWRLSITGNSGNNPSGRLTMYPNMTAGGGISAGSQIIWGAQLELGSFATSYIPTGAATATRNADVASVSTQAFPYSATEGSIVVNASSPCIAAIANMITLDNGTTQERIRLLTDVASVKTIVTESNTTQANLSPGSATANTPFKFAVAYKVNDFAAVVNGSAAATDAAGNVPVVNIARLGADSSGNYLNGHIRQITYLPRRITNAELVTRST